MWALPNPNEESRQKSHEQAREEMIDKYSQGLDAWIFQAAGEIVSRERRQEYMLLTGSTGNIGAQMLASLLSRDNVHRVYTLNRPSTKALMMDQHRERFEDKALDISLLESPKLVFLEGEIVREDIGLSQERLNEVS